MTAKPSPRAKRPTPSALRKRAAAGEDIDGIRAGVSLGKGNTDVLTGRDDPADWDDEELLHGRRRDRNGAFQGADPQVIPKAVQDELTRRMMRKAHNKIRQMNDDALEQLEALITGSEVDDKVRIKAIEMVLNRNIGKVPERLEVGVSEQPWERLVVEGITYGDEDDVIETTGEEA